MINEEEENRKITEVLMKLGRLEPGYIGCPHGETYPDGSPLVMGNQYRNHTKPSGRFFYSKDRKGCYIHPCEKHLHFYLAHHEEIKSYE